MYRQRCRSGRQRINGSFCSYRPKKLRSTVQCKFFSLYGYSYEMLWVGSPVYSGIDGRMERIGALPVATFTITWVLV